MNANYYPIPNIFYRPQTKLREGYVFTPVCHSVHMGGCLPLCMLGYIPGQTPPPPPRDGYCCGLYASYWNAFLLHNNSLSVIYTDLPMRSSLSTLQKCTRKQMLNNYCYRAVQWNSLAAGRSGFRSVVF